MLNLIEDVPTTDPVAIPEKREIIDGFWTITKISRVG
jgi:hypothetical protein